MNRSAGCGAPVASSHHPILPGSSCHGHPMWDLWFIRHSSKKNQDALGNNLDSAFLAGRAHLCYIQISHDLPQVQQQRLSLGRNSWKPGLRFVALRRAPGWPASRRSGRTPVRRGPRRRAGFRAGRGRWFRTCSEREPQPPAATLVSQIAGGMCNNGSWGIGLGIPQESAGL